MHRLLWVILLAGVMGVAAEPDPAYPRTYVDDALAAKVPVVLRVELIKAATAVEKYGYDQVKVLQVYKNDTRVEFPKEVTIAFRNTDSGVPAGVSTVYLVDYRTPPDGKLWRIVEKSHFERK